MNYLIIKSLHVISVISWFAGLIYLGRLLIYHQEASSKPNKEKQVLQAQFQLMSKRVLRIICNPAMIASFIFGFYIAGASGAFAHPWFQAKFSLTILLVIYHMLAANIMKKQVKQTAEYWTSTRLRIFNEILTIFLISIIFLVITKDIMLSLKATTICILSVLGIMLIVKQLKK